MEIKSYIGNAIINNKTVRIKYTKYDGTVSIRTISDIKYSDEFGNDYIDCYCHKRQERRTFKISRIDEVDGIRRYKPITPPQSHTSSQPIRPTYTPSSPQKSEGCYIATMVYGDYDHPQVLHLRKYRDERLLKSRLGRGFVKLYYFISPKLVYLLKDYNGINNCIRKILDKIVEKVK